MVKLLEPNEETPIIAERKFRDRFRDQLFKEVVLPTAASSPKGITKDELKKLAAVESWFYGLACALADGENKTKMVGKVSKIVRPHRIRLERIQAHLKNAARALDQAAAVAQTEQEQGLKRGVLEFRTAQVAVNKLTTDVARLRQYVICHLPADQRTAHENRALRFSEKVAAQEASRGDKLAALRNEVIMQAAKKLKTITKGRVPDSNIDRVISAFFHAIGRGVGAGNVKTIRHRRKSQMTKGARSRPPEHL